MGYSYADFNGERLAIAEFNENHKHIKISKIYGQNSFIHNQPLWAENYYLAHFINHELFNNNDGMIMYNELPLE